MQINYFRGYTDSEPKGTTLSEVVRLIADDASVRDLTEKHRYFLSVGDAKRARQCKHLLPCFAVAVRLSGGKQQCHIVEYTGLSIVDLDHVAPDDMPRVLTLIKQDPHTLLAYTTVSGSGIRVIARFVSNDNDNDDDNLPSRGVHIAKFKSSFKLQAALLGADKSAAVATDAKPRAEVSSLNLCRGAKEENYKLTDAHLASASSSSSSSSSSFSSSLSSSLYKVSFLTINRYYQQLTGLEPDLQCKNVTRLSGIAHDPAVYYNPEAEPFVIEPEERKPVGRPRGGKSEEVRVNSCVAAIVEELERRGVRYVSGEHNRYISQACYLMNRYGVSEAACTEWALEHFADYAERHDLPSIVRSCYQQTSEHGTLHPPREQKERYASVREIQDYLTEKNIRIRHNLVSRKWEYFNDNEPSTITKTCHPEEKSSSSWLQEKLLWEDKPSVVATDAPFASASTLQPSAAWTDLTDRHVNSLYRAFSLDTGRRLRISDLYIIIESDFYPTYHPFKEYLESLPQWDGHDYIEELASRVHVVGCEQAMHNRYFKKWFVAMVATWIDDGVTNHEILTYIGSQGIYKSTFMRLLLPPALRAYFSARNFAHRMNKDDRLELTEMGLIALEELDHMKPAELNQLKAITTDPTVNERAAYAHFRERREHIASFCGTGNNSRFLTDLTGNRRWLPFMVDTIDSPYEHPFPYEGLYAQAYTLWHEGFPYWFSHEENAELETHNRHFEEPNIEEELILTYLRKPYDDEVGEFVTATRIIELIGVYIKAQLSPRHITMIMKRLGFEQRRTNTARGWNVVFLTGDEIKSNQRQNAHQSRLE